MTTQYKYSTKQWKRRIVSFHPIFKDKTGSTNAAILLQQIAFWSGTKDDGWFYKTQKEWDQEISFSLSEIKIARKTLLDLDLIEYETKGKDNKGHYKLNEEEFEKLFSSGDENIKKTIKKNETFTPETAEVIDCFAKNINPNCETMYSHKSQRDASQFLIDKLGKENLLKLIPKLKEWNATKFVSRSEKAYTPFELKNNFAAIAARHSADTTSQTQIYGI